MSASGRLLRLTVLAAVAALAGAGVALGNGDTQREVRGRIVAVDPPAGTLVVDRVFRGRTARVTLRVPPEAPVFVCAGEPPALDQLEAGTAVSVFYEVLGAEGVANLVVVEPTP